MLWNTRNTLLKQVMLKGQYAKVCALEVFESERMSPGENVICDRARGSLDMSQDRQLRSCPCSDGNVMALGHPDGQLFAKKMTIEGILCGPSISRTHSVPADFAERTVEVLWYLA